MKLAFVTECDYFAITDADVYDVILFPFYIGKPVDYSAEIAGKTHFFKTLTNLSKSLKTTIIAGVDTNSYGKIRHSAAVCANGKLLAVADMNYSKKDDGYTSGVEFALCRDGKHKIGVLVGHDIYSSESAKTLVLSGAEILVHIADPIISSIESVFARARAYECGVPVAVCAHKQAMLAGVDGKIAFSSPSKISAAEIKPVYNYRALTVRRRGFMPEL